MIAKRTFVTLDGLRGVAALAVVTSHAPAFFASISVHVPQTDITKASPVVGPFFESYLAVDFFFALSGFVLAYAYGDRIRAGMNPMRFMAIRIIRLYPLYFLALSLSFVDLALGLAHGVIAPQRLMTSSIDFLFALFFLPSPTGFVLFPLNPPAWSLFFELLANALYGGIGGRLRTPWLVVLVSIGGSVLLVAVIVGRLGFGSAGIGAMADGFEWRSIGAGAARVAFSFFAGVLVFRVRSRWQSSISLPPFLVATLLAAVLVANPPERYQAAFDLIATLIVFPSLIFLGANRAPTGMLARVFTWIGTASYPVYVLQAPVYEYALRVVGRLSGGVGELSWLWGGAFVGIIFYIAIMADKCFDRPVRAALSARFLYRGQIQTDALPPA